MSTYGTQNVICPFFLEKQNDQYRIKCEGPVRNTTTQITFKGDKRWYMKDFCCQNYKSCRVFKMLSNKYE